jgi:signal transduction histidine kinase
LLLVLHPIVGEASNSLLLAGPVVATLLFSLRVGVFFIFINTIANGFVFTHFGMSGEEGRPKALISLLVTVTVCWGAERLRSFIEQRRAMEDNLHHAQKVEAIGRLAAGVAHDINNTLNAIMGSTFALRHELASYGRSFQDLENIALACTSCWSRGTPQKRTRSTNC